MKNYGMKTDNSGLLNWTLIVLCPAPSPNIGTVASSQRKTTDIGEMQLRRRGLTLYK